MPFWREGRPLPYGLWCGLFVGEALRLPLLPCQIFHLTEHILNKYPIPRGGIIDQHVRHRTDNLAVLNDRAARQECGQ